MRGRNALAATGNISALLNAKPWLSLHFPARRAIRAVFAVRGYAARLMARHFARRHAPVAKCDCCCDAIAKCGVSGHAADPRKTKASRRAASFPPRAGSPRALSRGRAAGLSRALVQILR